jgi:hypothetical protein
MPARFRSVVALAAGLVLTWLPVARAQVVPLPPAPR